MEANRDIVERSAKSGVRIWKTRRGNLEVSCERVPDTDYVSLPYGIVATVDSTTGKIVGMELLAFRDLAFAYLPPLEETYRRYQRARSERTKFDRGLKLFWLVVAAAFPELTDVISDAYEKLSPA